MRFGSHSHRGFSPVIQNRRTESKNRFNGFAVGDFVERVAAAGEVKPLKRLAGFIGRFKSPG